jgi:hypothetical protein
MVAMAAFGRFLGYFSATTFATNTRKEIGCGKNAVATFSKGGHADRTGP